MNTDVTPENLSALKKEAIDLRTTYFKEVIAGELLKAAKRGEDFLRSEFPFYISYGILKGLKAHFEGLGFHVEIEEGGKTWSPSENSQFLLVRIP